MQGPDAVAAVLAQLEGYEAPAAAWETDLLPARITEYEPEWLDEHCRAGRFVWSRLAPRAVDGDRGAAPVRSTPITLLARRNVKVWSAFPKAHDPARLTTRARAVMEYLGRRRLVLRRDRGKRRHAAGRGRRGSRGAGGARRRELGQFRRPACSPGAERPARPCIGSRQTAQATDVALRDGRCGTLGAGAPPGGACPGATRR